MSFVAGALGVMGVAKSFSDYSAGKAEAAQANYNAGIERQQASMIEAQKGLEGYQYDRAIARMRATTVSRTAKSGLLLKGSPLATLIDTETQMQLDKSVGQYNLEYEKRYHLSVAEQYSAQARYAKARASSGLFTGLLQTGAMVGMASMNYGKKTNLTSSRMAADMGYPGKGYIAPPYYYAKGYMAPPNYYAKAGRL